MARPAICSLAPGGLPHSCSFAGRRSVYGSASLKRSQTGIRLSVWPFSMARRSVPITRRPGQLKKGHREGRKDRETPGRSRGGFGTKVCVAADGHGRALSFTLSPGQAHELPCAYALLDDLPYPPIYVVCDRGYASHKFREYLWSRDLALSSHQGRMIQKSPVQNGLTDTDIWSKTRGQGSRNGGPLPHAMKRRLRPSSPSLSSLLQQTTSRPNRP